MKTILAKGKSRTPSTLNLHVQNSSGWKSFCEGFTLLLRTLDSKLRRLGKLGEILSDSASDDDPSKLRCAAPRSRQENAHVPYGCS